MPAPAVERHRTAIHRADFSRPIQCALHDGLIDPAGTLFDYGCGHGSDLHLLAGRGIACSGWDPVHRPATPLRAADVVNLGFVINVIEDPAERAAVVQQAWRLAGRLLIVAAQVRVAGRGLDQVEFGDGILTTRGTFQKYFEQGELREYLEAQFDTDWSATSTRKVPTRRSCTARRRSSIRDIRCTPGSPA